MLAEQVKLNRVFNQIMDLAEREGVLLEVFGVHNGPAALVVKEGDDEKARLYFNQAKRTQAYNEDRPPMDWDEFLNTATDIFVRKNTDYDSRYTRALMATKDPAFLWAWEVEKKLDRIRSWVARGELLVKGEGVANSVHDLFNYTVMLIMFYGCRNEGLDPLVFLRENDFYQCAHSKRPEEWVAFLEKEGLVDPEETDVKAIILKYMGVGND